MFGMIPVMRVGYRASDITSAFFVRSHSSKYRKKLKSYLCEFFSVDDIILTSSGRCAIYMIVRSLPQHKVIIPSYTCEVVTEAILRAGKEIIYAPVNKSTLNISHYPEIDSDSIILATHQYGMISNDIFELSEECKKRGAVLVEDCAGSFGGTINGQLTGTIGDYAVFSFSASKTFNSPTKGGFIIARNRELLAKVLPFLPALDCSIIDKTKQLIKAYGFCLSKSRLMSSVLFKLASRKRSIIASGEKVYQQGLYDWQAFVLLRQLTRLDSIIKERKTLVAQYDSLIKDSNQITKPCVTSNCVCIRYPILVKERDRFVLYCNDNHILVGTGYNKLYCPQTLENALEISREIVYLPYGNGYTKEEIEWIIHTVNSFS